MNRYVHLSPRLMRAAEMLEGYEIVADIGCDHGRLAAALLQRNACRNVVATDISAESLEKAQKLISHIGLESRVSFRVGNGLSVLEEGECDAIAILGMGGTLMRRILEQETVPMKGAKAGVFQPMRAQADIRQYLYENCFHITEDCIVYEYRRYYQVFRAEKKDTLQSYPDWWPDSFFDIGFIPVVQHDPNAAALLMQHLEQQEARMEEAKGSSGEPHIANKIKALESIRNWMEQNQ